MSSDRTPSAGQVARSERIRLASIESAKAMAEVERERVAVRKNMERLRALRLARDAELAAQPKPETPAKKNAARKRAGG